MNIRKPKAISAHSRIGIVMPASSPSDPTSTQLGIRALQSRGLEVVAPLEQYSPIGYLGGSDEERVLGFNHMVSDPSIEGIFCVRGGYGVMRLLESIDYDEASLHPKLLVGYSDITALQLALLSRAGWTSVSGPMVAVEWPDIAEDIEDHFWRLCRGETFMSFSHKGTAVLKTVTQGTAEGRLIGGNLAAIVRLVGTPFLPDMEGALLFIEDIGEAPYRIDALLSQLQLGGVLESLGGVILGHFTDCISEPGKSSFTIDEVLDQYFSRMNYPVARGLNYGHVSGSLSLPIGIKARLTAKAGTAELSMLEAVVSST